MNQILSQSILEEMNKTISAQDNIIQEQYSKILEKNKLIEELTINISTYDKVCKENKSLVEQINAKNKMISDFQSLMDISTAKFETLI